MSKYFTKDKSLVIKAILPFVVILGHLSYRVDIGWLKPVCHLGAIAVSVFLFISGYGLVKSFLSKRDTYIQNFAKSRFPKIIIPYLVTVALYYLIVRIPAHEMQLTYQQAVATGTSYQSHLWYVFAILALYMGFYHCYKHLDKKLALSLLTLYTIVLVVTIKLIGYDRCWYVGLLAFPFGATYASYEQRIAEKILEKWWKVLIALVVLAGLIGLCWITGSEWVFCIAFALIPLIIILICVILPIEALAIKPVKWLAGISYELYLCQLIVMDSLRSSWCNVQSDWLYIALSIALIIPLSMVLHYVCNPKLLKKNA